MTMSLPDAIAEARKFARAVKAFERIEEAAIALEQHDQLVAERTHAVKVAAAELRGVEDHIAGVTAQLEARRAELRKVDEDRNKRDAARVAALEAQLAELAEKAAADRAKVEEATAAARDDLTKTKAELGAARDELKAVTAQLESVRKEIRRLLGEGS